MALCLMNPIETPRDTKINKCALKLLGIGCMELTDEEILECISKYINPASIEAFLYDSFNDFYVLFLRDIESTCRLVGRKLECRSLCINIYPLLDCYVIDNVYPSVRNEELREIFGNFGHVFSVSNHHIVPNSSKFSHVLSGKREITFLLPRREVEVHVPLNVMHPPYSFHARKFCCACLTEGHSVLKCPDNEDEVDLQKIKCDDTDSDGELEALIKSESIDFDDPKVEDPLPDTQPILSSLRSTKRPVAVETMRETEGPSQDISEMNTEKADDTKQAEVVKDVSQEEKYPNGKKENIDSLTQVVSTTTVCRVNKGKVNCRVEDPPSRHVVKGLSILLPPLAVELINEICGPSIIEANVLKQLVISDGRLKTEMIKFALSYLEDMTNLLTFSRAIFKRCNKDKKYANLKGPFTAKVKLIHSILSRLKEK